MDNYTIGCLAAATLTGAYALCEIFGDGSRAIAMMMSISCLVMSFIGDPSKRLYVCDPEIANGVVARPISLDRNTFQLRETGKEISKTSFFKSCREVAPPTND